MEHVEPKQRLGQIAPNLAIVYIDCGVPLPINLLKGQAIHMCWLDLHPITVRAPFSFTLYDNLHLLDVWPEVEMLNERILARRGYYVGTYRFADIKDRPPGTRKLKDIPFIGSYRNRGV